MPIGWQFQPADPYEGFVYGNPGEYATPRSVESLVRESAQNSLDAGLGSITMRYTLIELTPGSVHRQSFLDALSYDAELKSHIAGAMTSAGNKQVGLRLKRGLKQINSTTRPLRLLRIEDFGAKGLSGAETGRSPFAALVRNVMDSLKSDQTAGGSYGLGSRTLWAASGISTVLFSSLIHEEESAGIRVIGKADLPYHGSESVGRPLKEYRGAGFYGEPVQINHANSVYVSESDELLNRLFLNRVPPPGEQRATGTTALIVAFNDASSNSSGGAEVVKAFARHAARNFWPAMLRQQLTVHVEHHIDAVVASSEIVNPDEIVPSLTDAFRKHLRNDVVGELEHVGDVVSVPVLMSIPATKDEGGVEPEHEEISAECRLVVRLADSASSDTELMNSVGFTRGRGMITRYVSRRGFSVGSRPFHAVLLAGTIAGEGSEQKAAETFLRWTEPVSHDDWTQKNNTDVYERYAHGLGVKLDMFKDAVFSALRDCTSAPPRASSEGPDILRESFQLRKQPQGRPSKWRLLEARVRLVGGLYEVSGIVAVDGSHAGTLTPTLGVVTESGGSIRAPWEQLSSEDAAVVGTTIHIEEGGRFRFTGTCGQPNDVPGLDLSKCAVQLSVSFKRDGNA